MAKEYVLNHWTVRRDGDVYLQGRLHGRPDYPEGSEIMTSFIRSWTLEGDDLVLSSSNSRYRCSLREYAGSIEALILLRDVEDDGSSRTETCGQSMARLLAIRKEQSEEYRKIFEKYHIEKGVLISWNGCGIPYINRLVCWDHGKIETWQLPSSVPGLTASVMFSSTSVLNVSCEADRSGKGSLPALRVLQGETVLIENTGNCSLYVSLTGKKKITVQPGGINCISNL